MKFEIKPFFVAVWTVILAIGAIFLRSLFSKRPEGKVNIPSKPILDKVSEDEYVHPNISKEEEAADYQTQNVNTVIKDGAEKVKAAKKDSDIKTVQDRIDTGWDEL